MEMHLLTSLLAWYAAFLISIVCHEAAHSFMASRLGDKTSHEMGLMTLDPMPHIRRTPFGMVFLPILSFVFNGWMIGWASVPISREWSMRYPKKDAIVSAMGPAANMLLAAAAGAGIKWGVASEYFVPGAKIFGLEMLKSSHENPFLIVSAGMLGIIFSLNIALMVFNLLPVPPLDGSSILRGFLNGSTRDRFDELRMQPTYLFIGLLAAWHIYGIIFAPFYERVLRFLMPGA